MAGAGKMQTLAVFLVAIGVVSALPTGLERIIGGLPATIDQFPFAASMLSTTNLVTFSHFCGGTVISTRAVLTSAFCMHGELASNWRIRVGSSFSSSGGVVHNVNRITASPTYNHVTRDGDIAILRTVNVIALVANQVQAAVIPEANIVIQIGQALWTLGWGASWSAGAMQEQLRFVRIWAVLRTECAQLYTEVGRTVSANMICAGYLGVGGVGPCSGDMGAPLIVSNTVVGVFSFSNTCGDPKYPSVFTRVTSFRTWILENLN